MKRLTIIFTIVFIMSTLYFSLPFGGFFKSAGMLMACMMAGLFVEFGMQLAKKRG